MADLSVKYAGMTLKNPLICGSGPLTDFVEGCKAAADAGFAALVLKSRAPRGGGWLIERQHAVPRFHTVDRERPYDKWIPRRGIRNLDVVAAGEAASVWSDKYGEFINNVKAAVGKECLVGASVAARARDPESWDDSVELFQKSDCDFIEINMGYARFYQNMDVIPDIIKRARSKLKKPLTVKMYPYLTFPPLVAKMLEDSGVNGLTMFDACPGLDFDINVRKPPIWNTFGYIPSGYAMPYTNAFIAKTRLAGVKCSISASFGPWEWQDVVKCIMSGADAVQMCRKIMVRGYQEATTWLNDVNKWLDDNKYPRLYDLKGKIFETLATDLREAIPREDSREIGGIPSKLSNIDLAKCHGCTDWCTRVCMYHAISPDGKKAKINQSKCAGCGACEGVCPHGALSLQPNTAKI